MLADRLLGLVLMVISSCLFVITLSFPFQASVYPSAVLVAIFLLSLFLCLFPQSQKRLMLQGSWGKIKEYWQVPAMLATTSAFIVCIEPLGFYLALFPFMIVSQCIMGARKPAHILVVSLLMTVLIYGLFSLGLQLNIPMGPLEF